MKRYKSIFKEVTRINKSNLAHGNTRRKKSISVESEPIKKIRVGQRVIFTGEENPDKDLDGLLGKIISRDKNPRHVIVQFDNGDKYLIALNDLEEIK